MAHSYGSLVYSVALKKKKIYFKLCVWMYDCVGACVCECWYLWRQGMLDPLVLELQF